MRLEEGAGRNQGVRDRQRQETFSRVFEAAMAEFRRVGVEKAQIDPICEAAGVARGTFYFHFPTKDHVLLERQRQLSAAIAERLEQELPLTRSVKGFLMRVADASIDEHEALGDVDLAREINAAIVRRGGGPELKISATPFGHTVVRHMRKLQEAGLVRSDIAADELADCFRLSLLGFLVDPQDSFSTARRKVKLAVELYAEAISA
jgi:AcrR family transcriptional regulator